MKRFLVGLCFLFPAMVYAAEAPVKIAENPVPENSYAVVSVALEKGDQVAFQIFPLPKKKDQEGGKLFFNGPKGTKYTVFVTIVNFGEESNDPTTKGYKKRFDTGSTEVTIAGEGGGDEDPEPLPVDPVSISFPKVGEKVGASLVPGFRAAWNKDSAADRILVSKLAQLYSKFAASDLKGYVTWGELEAAMRLEAAKLGVAGKLINTQTTVAEYLTKYLPGGRPDWQNVVIEDKGRKSAKTAFLNVSAALSRLK